MVTRLSTLLALLLPFALAATAAAQTTAATEPTQGANAAFATEPTAAPAPTSSVDAYVPIVRHAPPIAWSAGQPIVIQADIEKDWAFESLDLVYRTGGGDWQQIPFKRAASGQYQVIIPDDAVRAPGVDYYIASVTPGAGTTYHFGTPGEPHPINVYGTSGGMIELERLEAWGGRRSSIELRGQWFRFGSRPEIFGTEQDLVTSDKYSDQLWVAEGEYVYRPLTALYDFRFGFGFMRGRRPEVAEQPIEWPGEPGAQPGLNYGFSQVTWSLHPYVAIAPRLILGASQQGFVAGGGGVAYLGYISGTHLAIGVDGVADVGYRTDFSFHWDTVPHSPMALGLEVTNWPYAERPQGAAIYYEAGFEYEGFTIGARVGRANRAGSQDAGYLLGARVRQDF